jgi:hypothetical protein
VAQALSASQRGLSNIPRTDTTALPRLAREQRRRRRVCKKYLGMMMMMMMMMRHLKDVCFVAPRTFKNKVASS